MLAPKDYVNSAEALSGVYTKVQAEQYTRWLATHHYENFHVVSFLLPKRLHQDFYNVYAFCRWADDLGDEIGDTAESLRLLGWWREELEAMYAGRTQHPVFVALEGTVHKYELPKQLFSDLITLLNRTSASLAMPAGTSCSATAGARRIPWGVWCCGSAAMPMPSATGCRTPPAPRCSSPISGRM
jgi:hypothetical protein